MSLAFSGQRAAGPRLLRLSIKAPLYNDPPAPASPPGATDQLWDYEVVELFLMGAEERYLEVEVRLVAA